MNILLTNDDGYQSEGINILRRKLKPYGRVIVVAPNGPMSAKSVSITIGKPLTIKKIEEDVYSCDGTPSDCVSFAMSSLGINFDLTVSGINNGWNVSYDTLFSGTCGAALTSLIHRVPSIAFSSEKTFLCAEKHFEETWDFIQKHNLIRKDVMINVNFPIEEDIKGIEIGSIYHRNDYHYFEMIDENHYLAKRKLEDISKNASPNSDCYQISHGIISIVPMNMTCFSNEYYRRFKENK